MTNNPQRVSHDSNGADALNSIHPPCTVDPRQAYKFEEQNDISVNVYFLKKKCRVFKVLLHHLTSQKKDRGEFIPCRKS